MTNIVDDFKDMDTYDLFEFVAQQLADSYNYMKQDRTMVSPQEIEDLYELVLELENRYMKETQKKGE